MEVQRKLVGSTGDGGSWVTVQAKRVAPEGPLTGPSVTALHVIGLTHVAELLKMSACASKSNSVASVMSNPGRETQTKIPKQVANFLAGQVCEP